MESMKKTLKKLDDHLGKITSVFSIIALCSGFWLIMKAAGNSDDRHPDSTPMKALISVTSIFTFFSILLCFRFKRKMTHISPERALSERNLINPRLSINIDSLKNNTTQGATERAKSPERTKSPSTLIDPRLTIKVDPPSDRKKRQSVEAFIGSPDTPSPETISPSIVSPEMSSPESSSPMINTPETPSPETPPRPEAPTPESKNELSLVLIATKPALESKASKEKVFRFSPDQIRNKPLINKHLKNVKWADSVLIASPTQTSKKKWKDDSYIPEEAIIQDDEISRKDPALFSPSFSPSLSTSRPSTPLRLHRSLSSEKEKGKEIESRIYQGPPALRREG